MREFFEELFDELTDFWEDFFEQVFHKKPVKEKQKKKISLYGTSVFVRPAYVFAERVENFLKSIFGLSIVVSALISSFWGLLGLSDLIKILIHSIIGRVIMVVIGFSYFIIGVWKIAHLKNKVKTPPPVFQEKPNRRATGQKQEVH